MLGGQKAWRLRIFHSIMLPSIPASKLPSLLTWAMSYQLYANIAFKLTFL